MSRNPIIPKTQFVFGRSCEKENSCGNRPKSDRMSSMSQKRNVSDCNNLSISCNVNKSDNHASDAETDQRKAKQLFRECPGCKLFIWAYCFTEILHKHRFSISEAMELAGKLDWVKADGEAFRIDNSLSEAITCLFLQEHPAARPYMEMQPAQCNGGDS